MRVLTFQSKKVLDILKNNDEYIVDKNLCREKRDYKLELEKYGYESPIWVFAPIGWNPRYLKMKDRFVKEDFINASKFMSFKCEMSINDTLDLNSLFLLELEVDENNIKDGLTHNGCSYVKVINRLNRKQIKAIYRLEYDRIRETGWFFPFVRVIDTLCEDPLFAESFLCTDEISKAEF